MILSGGISCDADVADVCAVGNSGIAGIITGKAIYEGRFNLGKVISEYQQNNEDRMDW